MTTLIITLLAAVGLSHIIVDSSLLSKLRGWLIKKYSEKRPWIIELITCYQCTGFWTGALMGLLLQPIIWHVILFNVKIYDSLFWVFDFLLTPFIIGCATSYLSMAGAALLNWLDAPSMAMSKKNEPKA